MRLLRVQERVRLPMEDCLMGSLMIRLYGRRPKANRLQTVEAWWQVWSGVIGLAGVCVVLTVLLFTF